MGKTTILSSAKSVMPIRKLPKKQRKPQRQTNLTTLPDGPHHHHRHCRYQTGGTHTGNATFTVPVSITRVVAITLQSANSTHPHGPFLQLNVFTELHAKIQPRQTVHTNVGRLQFFPRMTIKTYQRKRKKKMRAKLKRTLVRTRKRRRRIRADAALQTVLNQLMISFIVVTRSTL